MTDLPKSNIVGKKLSQVELDAIEGKVMYFYYGRNKMWMDATIRKLLAHIKATEEERNDIQTIE